MTTAEAVQAKRWLQIAVYKLLREFEESTGLHVKSIDVKTMYRIAQDPITSNVTVTVELP